MLVARKRKTPGPQGRNRRLNRRTDPQIPLKGQAGPIHVSCCPGVVYRRPTEDNKTDALFRIFIDRQLWQSYDYQTTQ
jgi:hypothetical protein